MVCQTPEMPVRRFAIESRPASVDKQPHHAPARCAQWWTISSHKSAIGTKHQALRDRDLSVEVWPAYPNYVIDLEYLSQTWTANRKKQRAAVCEGSQFRKGISGPKVGFGIRLALAIASR